MTIPNRIQPQPSHPNTRPADFDGSATWLAEQTVLGALLHRPERIIALNPWLHPHDFADPQHHAVFATIQGLHAAGELQPNPDTTEHAKNLLTVWAAPNARRFREVQPPAKARSLDLSEAVAAAVRSCPALHLRNHRRASH